MPDTAASRKRQIEIAQGDLVARPPQAQAIAAIRSTTMLFRACHKAFTGVADSQARAGWPDSLARVAARAGPTRFF
jgi:hypothetical protein